MRAKISQWAKALKRKPVCVFKHKNKSEPILSDQIESQLAARTGAKPVGGHDLTGIQDQTNMAVDELFDDDSELETK